MLRVILNVTVTCNHLLSVYVAYNYCYRIVTCIRSQSRMNSNFPIPDSIAQF